MPGLTILRAALDELEAALRRRGIDLDAPRDSADPYTLQAQINLAVAYADAHIPARYKAAIADDPTVVTWTEQVIARAVADSAGHAQRHVRGGPSLLVLGPTGVGKTHQAYGALRLIAQAGIRAAWVSTTAADFYARLRPRHGVDSETEFRAVANAPVLLFDDLGAAKDSEWVEEVNYRLINHRYEQDLPTLLTSNIGAKELSSVLGERVASRLRELAKQVPLKGDDRRRALRPA
ncbi:ATP-binding protein [Streptosporangium sp. NPDC020145]|uniref:ATP-binding protein n=1 Tax=Streptosporangium sp. NPDC020145 TaxID=3154694 RepID=UPI0034345238